MMSGCFLFGLSTLLLSLSIFAADPSCSRALMPGETVKRMLYCFNSTACDQGCTRNGQPLNCSKTSINNLHNMIALYNNVAITTLDAKAANLFDYKNGATCGPLSKNVLRMVKLTNADNDTVEFYTQDECHGECMFGCEETAITNDLANKLNEMNIPYLKLYNCKGWPASLYILVTAGVCVLFFSWVLLNFCLYAQASSKNRQYPRAAADKFNIPERESPPLFYEEA